MVLRGAGPGDLPGVLALLAAAELPAAGVADALDTFRVAEAGGRIVGVAGLEVHGDDGVVRSVAVDPDVRGQGLGARLVEAVLDLARTRRLRHLYLLTTTAEGWFPRHGFRVVERASASDAVRASVEFAEACPSSAVAMRLSLETTPEPSPIDP